MQQATMTDWDRDEMQSCEHTNKSRVLCFTALFLLVTGRFLAS